MRVANILLFFCLLAITMVSTLLYFDTESPRFHHWIREQTASVTKPLEKAQQYARESKLDPRWGIGAVFAIVCLLFLVHGRFPRPSSTIAFFIMFGLVLAIGGFLAIYYSPENTIRLGNWIKIERGSQEEFAKKIEFGLILVLSFHLFLFLIVGLWQWISWKESSKPSKSS